MKMPTIDAMRARFVELNEKRDLITAQSTPLREERDAFLAESRPREVKFNSDIEALEANLFDIDQERAMIVRALGGKTSEPEAEAADEA